MSDEEDAESARTFLAALRTFLDACEAFGVDQLDPCDPIRELADDAGWAVDQVQAILDGAERRIKQARIAAKRRGRNVPRLHRV